MLKKQKVLFYIHGIGKENDVISVCKSLSYSLKDVKVIPIIWYDIFDNYEKEFIDKYNSVLDDKRKWLIYYAGDIILYEKMKDIIFKKLSNKLYEYIDCDINILAHSLGSVIISDFLYDNNSIKINNLFTVGSPLAVYSIRYGTENFNKPIKNCNNWINIWNSYDVVSYPLKKLNNEYNKVVNKDIDIKCGSLFLRLIGLAHLSYFNENKFYDIIKKEWKYD